MTPSSNTSTMPGGAVTARSRHDELRALVQGASPLRGWWEHDSWAEGFPAPPGVAEYLAAISPSVLDALLAEVAAAEARAEKAEQALREIANVATDLPHARRLDRDEMRSIARAALAAAA